MHSGKGDSGPRTPDGKARVAEAQRRVWRELKAAMGLPEGWMSTARFVCRQKREREAHTAAAWLKANKPGEPSS